MASLLRISRCVSMIRPLRASMRSNLPVTRRYASGEPQYNEPTGYLFNEKASIILGTLLASVTRD
jgi:hypothetical protein